MGWCGYLPPGYTYLLLGEENNFVKFRIKEVTDKDSAKIWIDKLAECSKVVWRIARTYPESGRCNIFKVCLRCQHATDKRVQGLKPSKNTDCPASLRLTIKRYIECSRSKHVDKLTKDWPTICLVKNEHNHVIENTTVFQHLNTLNEKNKIKRVKDNLSDFPSLIELENEAYDEESESLENEADDDESESLENEECEEESESLENEEYDEESDSQENEPYDEGCDSLENEACSDESKMKIVSCNDECVPQQNETECEKECNFLESPEKETLTELEMEEFETLIQRMVDGFRNEPQIFVPAMRSMIRNAKLSAADQNGLVAAMHTFGLHSIPEKVTSKHNHCDQNSSVQPITISKEEPLPAKRQISASPPQNNSCKKPKEEHENNNTPVLKPKPIIKYEYYYCRK